MILDSMLSYLLAASGATATIYGVSGEMYCGSPDSPQACDSSATTASGEPFDPTKPTAAVAIPNKYILRPGWVMLRLEGGKCSPVRINDRMNERYVHTDIRFDLSPAAVASLGGTPSPTWSGRVHICLGREIHGGRIEGEPLVAQGDGK